VQISLFCAIPLLLIDEAESLIVESSLSDSDEQNRNQQTIRVLRVHWTDCALLRCLSFDRPGLHTGNSDIASTKTDRTKRREMGRQDQEEMLCENCVDQRATSRLSDCENVRHQ